MPEEPVALDKQMSLTPGLKCYNYFFQQNLNLGGKYSE